MKDIATTPLCEIAYSYGTDKCPQIRHSYTPFYFELLKNKREKIKKVLEMGIGYFPDIREKKIIFDQGLKRRYHLGASLYMWRDFFSRAQIFGADDQSEVLFEDDRIKTFLCDERKREDILELVKKTGYDIDFFVDDAIHNSRRQIFLAKTLMPLLKKDVIYIIEDTRHQKDIVRALSEYDCTIPELAPPSVPCPDNGLIVVRNKP
jgi:hypothetical protein